MLALWTTLYQGGRVFLEKRGNLGSDTFDILSILFLSAIVQMQGGCDTLLTGQILVKGGKFWPSFLGKWCGKYQFRSYS